MKVGRATVQYIAKLARITVSDEDVQRLECELSRILDWVEQLDEVDTDGIEPMTSVVEMTLKMRADKVNDGRPAGDIVANAPERADHFFVVPKVIE